jgi:hypothetical protein
MLQFTEDKETVAANKVKKMRKCLRCNKEFRTTRGCRICVDCHETVDRYTAMSRGTVETAGCLRDIARALEG